MIKYLALAAALAGPMVPAAAAQDQRADASRNPTTVCGIPLGPPAALPPANSAPIVWQIVPCFEKQGNVTLVDPQTYLYYMQIQQKRSIPSQGVWVTYDESVEQLMREDFTRLYNTNFLDNISIETQDYTFSNGVDRQDPPLQHGGAAAGQDRHLPALQEIRGHQDRREAQGAGLRDPPRHVHRRGAPEEGERHHPRHDARERIPVRRGASGDRGAGRRAEAGPADVPHGRRSEGPDQEHRLHGQPRAQRRHAAGRDEAEQGTLDLVLDYRPRHLPGKPVRRRRPADHRKVSRERLHLRAGRRARAEVPRRLSRWRYAVGRAPRPGD